MKTLGITGLNAAGAQSTVKELQQLLADLHVFYMNLRGFHWNVQGAKFFALHNQFETMYDEIGEEIDEVAERILTLDAAPNSKFSEYLKLSNVKEEGIVTADVETVKATLDGMKVIIAQMRKAADVASESDDKVTEDMMVGFLEGHEKKVWMLVAFLK